MLKNIIHPDKDIITYELHKLINTGIYTRGITLDPGELYEVLDLSLLTYEGAIEKPRNKIVKKRSDEIDFANHYLQRNGDNEIEGLMYTISAGGNFIHSGPNGLTVELYGKGLILGHDSGAENYGTDIYRKYQRTPGSHNTVAIGYSGVTRYVPAYLLSIDPPIGSTSGVSDNHSFSLTSYEYNSSDQRRSIMMNRTAKNSGYYFDVFWSEGWRTDYIYHNQTVGIHNVTFRQNGDIKSPMPAKFNGPGYDNRTGNRMDEDKNVIDYFHDRKSYRMSSGNSTAEFKVDLHKFNKNVYMKAWIIGEYDRSYYSARTPYSVSVRHEFNRLSNSVIVIRDTSPNFHSKPFIVLYEPYKGDGRSVIDHVRRMDGVHGQFHYAGIAVSNSDRGRDRPDLQYLISSKDNNTAFDHEGVQFKGYSATVSHNDGELISLYLGKGSYISNSGYKLEKTGSGDITAYLEIEGETMTLASQDDVRVTMTYKNNNRAITYKNLGLYYRYKGSSEIKEAMWQRTYPADGVTTIGSGTIIGTIPNTDKKEVLLFPLEKRDYSGVNVKPMVKVYHNGVVSRRRILFDDDSDISISIKSPTGFYSDSLIIKKGKRVFSDDEYEVEESWRFGEAKIHLNNVSRLDSGSYKVSFVVPGYGYTRKEYKMDLVRNTATRLVKVFPNPYKYGEHDELNIEYFIPRNAKKSEYILLMVNILGDEMDSVSMSSVLDNTGMVYWNTFMVRKNYKPGLYMIALTDKRSERYTIGDIFW